MNDVYRVHPGPCFTPIVQTSQLENCGQRPSALLEPELGGRRSPAALMARVGKYETLMGIACLCSTALLIRETDLRTSGATTPYWMDVCTVFLLLLFFLDIFARIAVEWLDFFRSATNLSDLIIVLVDCALLPITTAAGDLPAVAILRSLRSMRIVRFLRLFMIFGDYHRMITGLLTATKVVVIGFSLIVACLTVFSIFATGAIHRINVTLADSGAYGECDGCVQAFSTVMHSILTLVEHATSGVSWNEFFLPLMEDSPWTAPLIIGSFVAVEVGMVNIIVVMVVDALGRARDEQEKILLKARSDKFDAALARLKNSFAGMRKDSFDLVTLPELLNLYDTNPALKEAFDAMDVQRDDLQVVFDLADGDVTYSQLMEQLQRIRVLNDDAILTWVKQHTMRTHKLLETYIAKLNASAADTDETLKGDHCCEVERREETCPSMDTAVGNDTTGRFSAISESATAKPLDPTPTGAASILAGKDAVFVPNFGSDTAMSRDTTMQSLWRSSWDSHNIQVRIEADVESKIGSICEKLLLEFAAAMADSMRQVVQIARQPPDPGFAVDPEKVLTSDSMPPKLLMQQGDIPISFGLGDSPMSLGRQSGDPLTSQRSAVKKATSTSIDAQTRSPSPAQQALSDAQRRKSHPLLSAARSMRDFVGGQKSAQSDTKVHGRNNNQPVLPAYYCPTFDALEPMVPFQFQAQPSPPAQSRQSGRSGPLTLEEFMLGQTPVRNSSPRKKEPRHPKPPTTRGLPIDIRRQEPVLEPRGAAASSSSWTPRHSRQKTFKNTTTPRAASSPRRTSARQELDPSASPSSVPRSFIHMPQARSTPHGSHDLGATDAARSLSPSKMTMRGFKAEAAAARENPLGLSGSVTKTAPKPPE